MKRAVFAAVLITSATFSAAFFHDRPPGKDQSLLRVKAALSSTGGTEAIDEPVITDPQVWPDPKAQAPQRAGFVLPEGQMRSIGHFLVGLLMVAVFCTFLATLAMASSRDYIMASAAWSVVDATNTTIIGVTLFNTVEDWIRHLNSLVTYLSSGGSQYAEERAALVYGIYGASCLALGIFASRFFKNNPQRLAIYNGILYWVILMAKSGATRKFQLIFNGGCPYLTAMVTTAAVAFCTSLSVIFHYFKPATDPRWWDDNENAVLGGTYAASVASYVDVVSRVVLKSPPWQLSLWQNGFAIFSLLLCVFATKPLDKMHKNAESQITAEHSKQYWKARWLAVLVGFAGTLPYFAVANGLGALICEELDVPSQAVVAQIIHAMANTALGGACVLVCAFSPFLRSGEPQAELLSGFIQGFGGFQAGYIWASLIIGAGRDIFNDDILGERVPHIMIRASRVAFNIVLLCFHVPIYVRFIKPLVEEKLQECKKLQHQKMLGKSPED